MDLNLDDDILLESNSEASEFDEFFFEEEDIAFLIRHRVKVDPRCSF